jgi:DNA-binding response OmpR family regulator
MSRILIVDDEHHIADGLSFNLQAEGHETAVAGDGERALQLLLRESPSFDVVILDVMLPGKDGFETAAELRAAGQYVPILMLTARGRPDDVLRGFEAGADDYLPKPFEPRELLARLRSILRRKSSPAAQDVKRYGRLEIDRAGRRVTIDGEERALTSYQFALLDALAAHAGRVMSRDALMDLTKGEQLEAFDRSVDVHISRIRAAIEDDPKKPRRIITVRGAGYVFAREQDRS